MVFSKKLMCLSLLLSASLISTRLSASAPAIVITGTALTCIIHVPVIVAGGVACGVGYAGYRFVKWLRSPSQATIQAGIDLTKATAGANAARELAENVIEKHIDMLNKTIGKLSADNTQLQKELIEAQKRLREGFFEKGKEALIGLKDTLPAELREKIGKKYEATVNVLKNGIGLAWKVTFKDHPYLTVTVVMVPVIYVIKKKYGKKIENYGKKIREKMLRILTSKEHALEKTQFIGIGNTDALIVN